MSPRTFLAASLAIGLALVAAKMTDTALASSAPSEPTYRAVVVSQSGDGYVIDTGLTFEDCARMYVDRAADICEVE